MFQYFPLIKNQTITINDDYNLTLEAIDHKLCRCFWKKKSVSHFVLKGKTKQWNFSLTSNDVKPFKLIASGYEIIIKFADIEKSSNSKFTKIGIIVSIEFPPLISTNGLYLKEIIQGKIDVTSNEKYPLRLKDDNYNSVLVWCDKTKRLHIVYV